MDKATRGEPRARTGRAAAKSRASRAKQPAEQTTLIGGDLLVFELQDGVLRLVGGRGRGQGWAGVVEAALTDEPLARRAARGNVPVRVLEDEPVKVIGPYWSRHAALVAVGDDHVVVVGDAKPLRASDGELRREAAEAVSRVGGIPSSKLLADELEVVDAVRKLMDYRPEALAATARHVADVAAASLSCDFAAVLVPGPGGPVVSVSGTDSGDCADPKLCDELKRLAARVGDAPLLEQSVRDRGRLGRGGGLVTRYALGIGTGKTRGMLVVGHDAAHPRGFTLLCQRVGRALADAAEVLLSQAAGREELAAERDRFARESRTDDLTGLANRIAWTEALGRERKRRSRYRRPVVVMSIDVDRLKDVNDTYGHVAGDELLRGAARVLVNCLRETDFVARIGGDEFGALLPETTAEAAAGVIDRIHAACRAWRGSHADLRLSLSIGWAAPEPFGDLQEALRTADGRMYASKRAG
ncbi:MAG TPA: GGDEF domain-containing protein [Candidatus Limnocylindria bacterium]|jgi:diguanylate cyclase (GGDEF)-like protein